MSYKNSKLINVLKNVDQYSCPYNYNFHMHTYCSDGSLDPIDLYKQASNIGLQHISITDHHSVLGYKAVIDWLDNNNCSNNRPKLWSGIEINSILSKCMVHILALDIDINDRDIQIYCHGESTQGKYLKADYLVNVIHNAGGLAILAHPGRYRIGFKELIEESHCVGLDGAEAWYDYNSNDHWNYSPFICESISLKLKELSLLSTCGTDTHGYSLIGR